MNNETKKLFSEFPTVSKEQWKTLVNQDLKGKDFEKTLVYNSIEGIKINPYFTRENIASMPHPQPLSKREGSWEIRQDINVRNPRTANKKALDTLMKGANSLGFIINEELDEKKINLLLKNILFEYISVNFSTENNNVEILNLFIDEIKKRKIDTTKINGSINCDPLGNLVSKGKWINSKTKDWDVTETSLQLISAELPKFHCININAEYYHNSGASIVQELAFSLAQANEYLVHLTDKNYSVDDLTARIRWTFAVGTNYLFEIAKLRAIRILWAKIVDQYHPQHSCPTTSFIHCTTSQRSLMIEDAHTNILRATTQVMSAVIGGANSVTVTPFDAAYQNSDNFSERIARNVQTIISEEAYFNKVANPADGSYFIEYLTHSIAEKAWEFFQNLEKQGGFIAGLENDFIHSEIAKSNAIRKENIATGKTVLVGVNKYKKS